MVPIKGARRSTTMIYDERFRVRSDCPLLFRGGGRLFLSRVGGVGLALSMSVALALALPLALCM